MVVGHARRPHGVELGLHRGVGRRRQYRELAARSEGVGHIVVTIVASEPVILGPREAVASRTTPRIATLAWTTVPRGTNYSSDPHAYSARRIGERGTRCK